MHELQQLLDKETESHIKNNIKNIINYFENIDLDEFLVPEDHVFLIGDDWFRSNDSIELGPIPINLIEGKIIGSCNTCKPNLKNN